MIKFNKIARLTCLSALLLAAAPAAAEPAPSATHAEAAVAKKLVKSGRTTVNGITYYYELHGQGEPLLLLHGGLGSINMFGSVLDQLAETRTVIAVDLQGHGRTPLGTRRFTIEGMGDDMAVLVKRLGYAQVDVLGYSLGGGVALRLAIQKPEAVRRLTLVSTPFSDAGFYAEMRAQQIAVSARMAPMMKDTPMYKAYAAVAPNVAEFPRLLDTLGEYMARHYDWSAEVPKVKAPVLLVYGDSDMFRPEHEIKFYQLLGGGLKDAGWARETMSKNRLAILPDATHYDIFRSPRLLPTVMPFLDGKSEAKAWASLSNR
jgi:pimeloyl-ACP methyl ester carboxylesterase